VAAGILSGEAGAQEWKELGEGVKGERRKRKGYERTTAGPIKRNVRKSKQKKISMITHP
jgi:hypothetical protein